MGIVARPGRPACPVAISFTVETDGRLPDGTPLARGDRAVDADRRARLLHGQLRAPRPTSPRRSTTAPGAPGSPGFAPTPRRLTHAELDEAEELDEGDPVARRRATGLARALPALRVVGGCCGTDARHVAALWGDRAGTDQTRA